MKKNAIAIIVFCVLIVALCAVYAYNGSRRGLSELDRALGKTESLEDRYLKYISGQIEADIKEIEAFDSFSVDIKDMDTVTVYYSEDKDLSEETMIIIEKCIDTYMPDNSDKEIVFVRK